MTFFSVGHFDFFFKNFFFASFPWKLVKVYWLARVGQNFDDYPGFQPKITPPNISAGSVCNFYFICSQCFNFNSVVKIRKHTIPYHLPCFFVHLVNFFFQLLQKSKRILRKTANAHVVMNLISPDLIWVVLEAQLEISWVINSMLIGLVRYINQVV